MPVIENDTPARKKLREAEHFLAVLRENEADTRLDREDFDFNLSAFFSAGRSVTFMLQKEDKLTLVMEFYANAPLKAESS